MLSSVAAAFVVLRVGVSRSYGSLRSAYWGSAPARLPLNKAGRVADGARRVTAS
jgi:hypothetical protein